MMMRRPASASASGELVVPGNLSNLSLDDKIKAFQKAVLGQDPKLAKGPILRKFFGPNDMSALWSRLNTAVKKSSPSLKQKWTDLKKKGQARAVRKNEQKNEILALKLTIDDDDEWARQSIQVMETFTATETHSREGEWFYRGELEQKLGRKEASEHIEMGKYESDEDDQGTKVYRKVRRIDKKEVSRGTSTAMAYSKDLKQGDGTELKKQLADVDMLTAIEAWASASSTGSLSLDGLVNSAPTTVRKRPAAVGLNPPEDDDKGQGKGKTDTGKTDTGKGKGKDTTTTDKMASLGMAIQKLTRYEVKLQVVKTKLKNNAICKPIKDKVKLVVKEIIARRKVLSGFMDSSDNTAIQKVLNETKKYIAKTIIDVMKTAQRISKT